MSSTSDDATFLMRLLAATGGPYNYREASKLEGKAGTSGDANAFQKRFKKLVENHGYQLEKGTVVIGEAKDSGAGQDNESSGQEASTTAKKRGRGRPLKGVKDGETPVVKKRKLTAKPTAVKQEADGVKAEGGEEDGDKTSLAEGGN